MASMAQAAPKSAAGVMGKLDANGDGVLDKSEWRKKRIFSKIDANGDSQLSRDELKLWFGEISAEELNAKSGTSIERPDSVTMAAIRRSKHDDVAHLKARGLFETGLKPVWPDEVDCRDIDHHYAMDYTSFRPKEAYHGGVDIPAPYNTPVLAAMDGEVLAKYMGKQTPRGIEVVLRHTPEQSGLPYYIYTRYTHFKKMPEVTPGQQVKMGQVLGITGNTGYQQCQGNPGGCRNQRRSLLHFDVLYSESDKYLENGRMVIPFEAHWMDPNALYRKKLPLDSASMKRLPEQQKNIPISYQLASGEVVPADTKMIWPYACRK